MVIVYVESNFVLEMALEQEQVLAAHALLSLAENRQIELAYPSFVLSEPFENIIRVSKERMAVQGSFLKVIRELGRSEPYRQISRGVEPAVSSLEEAGVRQMDLLFATFGRLLKAGRCIHTDAPIVEEASTHRHSLKLSPQDSMIYFTVVADLKKLSLTETKCFLSRDSKAFARPRVKEELQKYNCHYISNFDQCLEFVQNAIKKDTQQKPGEKTK